MSKFITIIRPDFMLFCHDACRAAALNHLLFRIAGKSKDAPQEKIISGEILWYARNEQIVEEMSNAWGLCKVRQEINALIHMGIIGRTHNPEWGADRTKHFRFGEKECRTFLEYCEMHQICVVHLNLPNEVKHLIYSSNANDKTIKCICSIHQMELINLSNANDESIEAIPIDIPTIDDYKDRHTEEEGNVISADAESDAPAPINFETKKEEKRPTNPSMHAIPVVNDSKKDEQEEEETTRLQRVKPSQFKHMIGEHADDRTDTLGSHASEHDTPGDLATQRTGHDGQAGLVEQTSSSLALSLSSPSTPGQHSGGVSPGTPIVSAGAVQEDNPPMALTPRQIQLQTDARIEEILALYTAKIGRKPSRSKANIDGALKLAQDDVNDADINHTIDGILEDPFLAKNLTLTFVYNKLDAFARKPVPIRQSNGASVPKTEPVIPRGVIREKRLAL